MSLVQVCGICLLGTFSLTLCKVLTSLLRRPHGIDLDGPDKGNWLIGNIINLFEGGIDYCVDIAEKYGGAVRLYGPDGETIYVSDPLALYHITIKDQHIFEELDIFTVSNKVVFGEGLISTVGEQHRRQRKLLNPFFSTSNMRRLLTTVCPIADRLASTIVAGLPIDGSNNEVDVLPLLSRCAFDGVWQGILGYSPDTLSTAENDAHTEAMLNISPLIAKLMLLREFVVIVMRYCSPYWARKVLDFVTVPWLPTQFMKDVRELRRIVETMDIGSRKALAKKQAAFDAKNTMDPADTICGDGDKKPLGQVRDMMDMMLKARSESSPADAGWLTDAELLGQMNVMVFAGLDTTTSALARCVHLLAEHPHAQARLRSEVRDAMKPSAHEGHDGGISAELPYDVLVNLPFLDGVVKETLRLYPSLPVMARRATKATTLPFHFPAHSRSGGFTSSVVLPKGTCTIISILAANRHRGMWGDDANEWRPERWLSSSLVTLPSLEVDVPFSEEDAASVAKPSASVPGVKDGMRFPGVHSNMMTFLGGGRSCVGFKFAEMEIKQVIASLLLRLHFALPTEPDAQGHVKEIQWKLGGSHIPVVKPPAGDGVTPQVPLSVRLVREEDFVW